MNLILKIKRAETPFYSKLKRFLLLIYRINVPTIKNLYKLLYYIRLMLNFSFRFMKTKLWDVPVFQALCRETGKGMVLVQGIPSIQGDIDIFVGHNVTLYRMQIEVCQTNEKPTLIISDNIVIGPGTYIGLSRKVVIEDHVLLGANNVIMDHDIYDEHQSSDECNRDKNFVVIEENVWTGRNVSILKGVRIGKNSIISANSLVMNDIPENVIAMGVPAKVVVRNVDRFYKDR